MLKLKLKRRQIKKLLKNRQLQSRHNKRLLQLKLQKKKLFKNLIRNNTALIISEVLNNQGLQIIQMYGIIMMHMELKMVQQQVMADMQFMMMVMEIRTVGSQYEPMGEINLIIWKPKNKTNFSKVLLLCLGMMERHKCFAQTECL